MYVRDALPGGRTVVQAHVVGIRLTFGIQRPFCGIEQCQQRLLLLRIEFEKRADMPFWNHQRMPWRNREVIPDHETVFITIQDARLIEVAEETIHRRIDILD